MNRVRDVVITVYEKGILNSKKYYIPPDYSAEEMGKLIHKIVREEEEEKVELSWEQIRSVVVRNICFSKSDMTGLFDAENTKKELGFK